MIDHFGINCADLETTKVFYDQVLGVLGYSRQMDFGVAIGYGRDGHRNFWISDGKAMGPNREIHAAFVRDPDGNNVEAVFHGGVG